MNKYYIYIYNNPNDPKAVIISLILYYIYNIVYLRSLRREGLGWISDFTLFHSTQNLESGGSGTFYGI